MNLLFTVCSKGDTHGVMVIVIENGHGNKSSNAEQGSISHRANTLSNERYESNNFLLVMVKLGMATSLGEKKKKF